MVFLPLGAILGPRGLQWFTPQVLTRLDTAVTIALAVLGVMVGVALARGMREHSRLLAAASLESAVTVAAVAGATAYFVAQTGIQVGAPLGAIAPRVRDLRVGLLRDVGESRFRSRCRRRHARRRSR